MNLVNNPIFKLVGIGLIIYFALFHDTSNKDNLRNRISSDKIKKNLVHIRDKASYIKENYDKSKKHDQELVKKESSKLEEDFKCVGNLIVNYIKLGNGTTIEEKGYKLEPGKSELYKKLLGIKVGEKKRVSINENVDGKNIQFIYDVELLEIVNQTNNKECNN